MNTFSWVLKVSNLFDTNKKRSNIINSEYGKICVFFDSQIRLKYTLLTPTKCPA